MMVFQVNIESRALPAFILGCLRGLQWWIGACLMDENLYSGGNLLRQIDAAWLACLFFSFRLLFFRDGVLFVEHAVMEAFDIVCLDLELCFLNFGCHGGEISLPRSRGPRCRALKGVGLFFMHEGRVWSVLAGNLSWRIRVAGMFNVKKILRKVDIKCDVSVISYMKERWVSEGLKKLRASRGKLDVTLFQSISTSADVLARVSCFEPDEEGLRVGFPVLFIKGVPLVVWFRWFIPFSSYLAASQYSFWRRGFCLWRLVMVLQAWGVFQAGRRPTREGLDGTWIMFLRVRRGGGH